MSRTFWGMARVFLGMAIAVIAIHIYRPIEFRKDATVVQVAVEPERAGEHEIMAWFAGHLRDTGSLEIIEWGDELPLSDGGSVVAVRYRAANGFGGFTVETRGFVFDADGRIIATRN